MGMSTCLVVEVATDELSNSARMFVNFIKFGRKFSNFPTWCPPDFRNRYGSGAVEEISSTS